MAISNLICSNATRTNNKLAENPYLCEIGTFLDMRTRVKQMAQSGQLNYEYRKKLAQMQHLDDRFIDNDEDLNNENFSDMDEIDRFNKVNELHEKLAQNAQNETFDDSESNNLTEDEKSSENASSEPVEGEK